MGTQPGNQPPHAENIELYKSYLQDVGNIGVRHENSRRFYLSVPSALFAFLALAAKDGPLKIVGPVQTLVGILGILFCLVWFVHMQSFRAIYLAKFGVLRDMEEKFNFYPIFKQEWERLHNDSRYSWLKLIDAAVPGLFVILFLVLLFLK